MPLISKPHPFSGDPSKHIGGQTICTDCRQFSYDKIHDGWPVAKELEWERNDLLVDLAASNGCLVAERRHTTYLQNKLDAVWNLCLLLKEYPEYYAVQRDLQDALEIGDEKGRLSRRVRRPFSAGDGGPGSEPAQMPGLRLRYDDDGELAD